MKLSEFDYNLPEELIAQLPAHKRENSRMIVLNRHEKTVSHKNFFDIVDLLDENDVLVLNNTRVFPARLIGYKPTGAKIEVFLLKQVEAKKWEALLKPAKRFKIGDILVINQELGVKLLDKNDEKAMVELIYDGDIFEILNGVGQIPLPPYIERKLSDKDIKKLDFERYQTVFAQRNGSVAAPTAGLHFSGEILEKLKNKGVQIVYITLNVGLGTFRPVKCENILEHKMDSETFEISKEAADTINTAIEQGKNITAVGTTTVRTLETTMQKFGKIIPCNEASGLFIYPGFEFRIVNKLLTNFHLPKSTLLMLVSAFAGKDFVFEAYEQAIEKKYRFYSYGDCMFIN
ncbi:MAG: tRNA preQ1(34) S-adenosylmethionine ribosyltransferase-isomerase QueA [Candidatus Gastranaerophilales bacterium]|nr:tRNA preQ1(34) S-adenosylmethionine ribosyltransferase-isomerase QueA [Candidatus Gastranaerophilales bacterium]